MQARAAQGDKKQATKVLAGGRSLVSEKVVESVTVGRYWPGKAPKWSEGAEEEDGAGFMASSSAVPAVDRRLQRLNEARGSGARPAAAVLEEGGGDSESDSEVEAARRRRRRSTAAEVLEEAPAARGEAEVLESGGGRRRPSRPEESESESESEDDDAIEARRERLRAVQRRRQQEEREARATGDAGEEEESDEEEAAQEEGSSSYETDTDESEEEAGVRQMLKPVFVSASKRQTILEREAAEAEEQAAKERRDERLKARKEESRAILVEVVRKEEMGEVDKAIDFEEMPDDDDEVDGGHFHLGRRALSLRTAGTFAEDGGHFR